MESAISKGGLIDEKDFAKRFYYWFRHGYPELGDLCALGIGQTVFGVLRHPLFQSDPFTVLIFHNYFGLFLLVKIILLNYSFHIIKLFFKY